MSKRNLDQKVLTLDGKEFEPPLSLEFMCFNAVLGTSPDGSDSNMPLEKKITLHRLGKKIHKGGIVELTVEELTLLKERVGKSFGTYAVGQAFDLLDTDWVAPVADIKPPPVEATLSVVP